MFTKPEADPKTVASILGGGAGTRLFPLTGRRAKPAVPIGGCYRLIDVPMSNCINNGINKIYILTQFSSQSLNRHIARTYNLGNGVNFGDGFVEVKLSANGDEAWKDREAAVLALGAIAEGCISVLYPHLSEVTCGVRGKLDPPCNAVGYKDREVLGINHIYYHPAWRRSKDMEISTSLITTVLPLCF